MRLFGLPSVLLADWRRGSRTLAVVVAVAAFAPGALADTLPWALIQAYQNNPQITAQRAAARATDESVPIALSGYRPRATGTYAANQHYLDTTTRGVSPAGPNVNQRGWVSVHSYGATVTQNLFNGFVTANRNLSLNNLGALPLLFRETGRLGPPAFESSPCYLELLEHERDESRPTAPQR